MNENTPTKKRTASRTDDHRTAVVQPSLLGEPSENLGSPPRDQTIRSDLQAPPAASKAHLDIPDDGPDLPHFPPPPPPPPPAPPVLASGKAKKTKRKSKKAKRRKTRKGKKAKKRRTKRR